MNPQLDAVLDEIEELLDDQQDVSDGSDGPRPNQAMSLLAELRAARAAKPSACSAERVATPIQRSWEGYLHDPDPAAPAKAVPHGVVDAKDVRLFVQSLEAKGTPWADGCAAVLEMLWAEVSSLRSSEAVACDRCDPSFGCFDGSQACRKAPFYAAPAGGVASEDMMDLCGALEYTARALETMGYNHSTTDAATIREAIATLKALKSSATSATGGKT